MVTTKMNRLAPAACAALLLGIAAQADAQNRTFPTPASNLRAAGQPTPVPNLRAAGQPRPAAPALPVAPQDLLPTPDEPQGETPQQLVATQQDREWLIAYLISHEGYNIHQIDQLETRLEHMSPTLIGSLVMLYKQKHERAVQREAAVQAMRQNMVASNEAALRQQQQSLNRINSDENAAARYEQSRLDTQQQQTMQGYYQNQPYRTMPYNQGYPYHYYMPTYGY